MVKKGQQPSMDILSAHGQPAIVGPAWSHESDDNSSVSKYPPPKNYRKLTLFWETLFLSFGLRWLRKETFLFLCVVRWAYDRGGCVLAKDISQVCVIASLSEKVPSLEAFLEVSCYMPSFNLTQSLKYCLHSCFSFKPRLQMSFSLSVTLLQEGEFLKNE